MIPEVWELCYTNYLDGSVDNRRPSRIVLFLSEDKVFIQALDLGDGSYHKHFHYTGKLMPVGWRLVA